MGTAKDGEGRDAAAADPASPDGANRRARYGSGHLLGGRYRLETLAGEGSMGEVWLATNTALDLPVAIKLLRGDALADDARLALGDAFEEHLLREAKATAKLTHPSIVRVFDFGVTALGDPFIVMERLDGEDLREKINRDHALDANHAVQLLLPVVHAMHAAHMRGIVHRDLKPENIFLALDDAGRDTPKVVDFGIAAMPWAADGLGPFVAGTPAYMAPEQAAGEANLDHRADVWSISVVLYELVSGRVPFGSVADQSFERDIPRGPDGKRVVTRESLAPLGEVDGVDPALWSIISRGLARERSSRWRSMNELGEALAGWLQARGVEEDCQGVSLRARWLHTSPSKRPPAVTILQGGTPIPSPPLVPSKIEVPAALLSPIPLSAPTEVTPAAVIPVIESDPLRESLEPVHADTTRGNFVRSSRVPPASIGLDLDPIVLPKRRSPMAFVVLAVLLAIVALAVVVFRRSNDVRPADAAAQVNAPTDPTRVESVPPTDKAAAPAATTTESSKSAAPTSPKAAVPATNPAISTGRHTRRDSASSKGEPVTTTESASETAAPAVEPPAVEAAAPPPQAVPAPEAAAPAPIPTVVPNGRVDPDGL